MLAPWQGALKVKGYDVSADRPQHHRMVFLALKIPARPDLSGPQTARWRRNEYSSGHSAAKARILLVVIISAYGSEDRIVDAKEKGVHSFINKPFTEEKILQTIKQFQENGGQNHG